MENAGSRSERAHSPEPAATQAVRQGKQAAAHNEASHRNAGVIEIGEQLKDVRRSVAFATKVIAVREERHGMRIRPTLRGQLVAVRGRQLRETEERLANEALRNGVNQAAHGEETETQRLDLVVHIVRTPQDSEAHALFIQRVNQQLREAQIGVLACAQVVHNAHGHNAQRRRNAAENDKAAGNPHFFFVRYRAEYEIERSEQKRDHEVGTRANHEHGD